MDALETALAHFGVKGMKWGVSRTRSQIDSASEDAAKAKTLAKTVKKSGTSSLSNQELQALVTRMNLERQFAKLNEGQTSAGKKFVSEVLGNVAKQQATRVANDVATKQIDRLMKEAQKSRASKKK